MGLAATEDGYEGLVSKDQEGRNALSLLISGVHCAVCIQKIESTILKDQSVQQARLNFSTGRLNILWSGLPERANQFVADIRDIGYGVHPYNPDVEKNTADQESRFLLMCMGVAGFAMGNIMLLSVGLWVTDGATMGEATRNLLHWVSALIGIPAILFSGRPFFRSAWAVLRNGHTNMDVPISLALILATGMSLFETINHGEHVYFDSAVMLMFFLLIGRVLDLRARRNARSAATDLMQTLSGFAVIIEGGKTRRVLIRDVKAGMRVLVAAGEKVPVDGVVEDGESTIDTSLVTGETLPRAVVKGQDVYAGTLNMSAPLTIEVSKPADNSLLADIVRLMEKAEQGQAQYVRLADRAARLYTPVVHILALAAFVLWWGLWGAQWQDALLVAVTVLIITCPCALGLAVPVVQVLATGLLMKRGVLVKSGDALERLAKIDMALLDKTGTLTHGTPILTQMSDSKYLPMAASLAAQSAHPLSKSLVNAYDGELLPVERLMEVPGKGLEGVINGQIVRLGNAAWCCAPSDHDSAKMSVYLAIDGGYQSSFEFDDTLRDDAAEVIKTFRHRHIDTILLSGDRQAVADRIAGEAGIYTVYAEQTPVDKSEVLERYKSDGHSILMVGDGLNDAPVLAGADVSIAPGTAVDMAQNVADIVFMGDSLTPVSFTHHIARMTQRLVKQNFGLAIAYNVVAVPMAFAGLVTPMIAAIVMSGSSLLVIANSYRLKFQS